MPIYLEFIKPNQILLGKLKEVLQVSDVSPVMALNKRALMLRDILSGFGEQLSNTMLKFLHQAIALTIDPITEANVPEKPNPEAYDFSKEDQLIEFINQYDAAFDALLEYAKSDQYKSQMAQGKTFSGPQDRYLVLSEHLKLMINYMSPPDIKQVHYGMSQTYSLMETDQWPGRMIAEIRPQDKDLALRLVATTAKAMQDQAFFRLLGSLDQKHTEGEKSTVVPIYEDEDSGDVPGDMEPPEPPEGLLDPDESSLPAEDIQEEDPVSEEPPAENKGAGKKKKGAGKNKK